MNGVLAENAGRGDILLARGITNRLAVRWQQQTVSGGAFEPVDLTEYVCRLSMTSGDSEVYAQACDAHGIDGVAAVYIPHDAFTGTVWNGRSSGEWKITATKNNVTELLGWGYWHLSK